jgi:SmpA/OmlA family protein
MKAIIVAVVAIVLAGCASYSGRGLTPGQSSAAEVEAVMGPPAERSRSANGETVLWFPRFPFGRESHAARIGPDGRLIAIEQRLAPENVARLQPGRTTAKEVRDLLGPPWRADPFPRMQREIWTYPMMATDPTPKHLYVQFSGDGVLRELYLLDDPDWRARDSFE